MVITARYNGVCRRCGENVPAGSTVNWVRGQGVSHLDCAESADEAEARGMRQYPSYGGCRCEDYPCCGH
jgi:hypothetical protein